MKLSIASLIAASTALLLGSHASAETVRVTVAHYSNQTASYFEKMAQEFSRANPGITIKIEDVNWDTLQQKLQIDVSGGTNADLSIIGTRWLVDLVQDDIVEPLDLYMSPAFKDKFIGSFLAPGTVDGKCYGLPIAASARALYYNQAMLEKAGFPDGPKTWDDVIAATRKIKGAGGYGFGLQGKEIETDVYWYYALWSEGGEVLDRSGKAAFDSAAGIKAANLYRSMIAEGLTQPGVTSYSREDVQNLFKQGRLGMVITSPFLAKQIQQEVPNLKYGITAIPMGTVSATYANTDSLVMFKNSKVKQSAWKFANFLFSKTPRVAFSSGEGFLPTTKEEAADPAFADKTNKLFISLLPSAKFSPVVAGWEDVAKAVSSAMQGIYLGTSDPTEALKTAATQANRALKKQ
jgi:multiple sugar transport system substrate-binding protein